MEVLLWALCFILHVSLILQIDMPEMRELVENANESFRFLEVFVEPEKRKRNFTVDYSTQDPVLPLIFASNYE